ncbi:MAG: ABC transporter ATP-binding protein [Actinobacteria bacterium]|nr:ABC transporter ATP-binding protein [Actinomycetota bacterium]
MSLALQHIRLDLNKKRILDDVSFNVGTGEFISLLGASGAGKSTTLKVIAGILAQDSGHIQLDGEVVDDIPAHRRKTSIVFQDVRLFPHMTIEENVAFPLKMQGVPRSDRLAQARKMLGLVHLGGMGLRRPDHVSGGQQQRVALARALAGKPQVLLLDEPFSGLDEDLRDEMRELVVELHKALGTTTILVTHDATEALMISNRIVYMRDGRVIQDATPTELYRNPKTQDVASCFGDCSILSANVVYGYFCTETLCLPATCEDGPATAVIRHDGVRVLNADVSDVASEPASFEVKSVTYHGNCYLVQLDIEGQTLVATSKTPIRTGAHVTIAIDQESVFVYPAERLC